VSESVRENMCWRECVFVCEGLCVRDCVCECERECVWEGE
jgi:hypothetical protein